MPEPEVAALCSMVIQSRCEIPAPPPLGVPIQALNLFTGKINDPNKRARRYFVVCIWYKIYPNNSKSGRCRIENAAISLKKRPTTSFQSDFKNASKFTFSLAIPSFFLIRARCLRTVWTEVLNVAAISLQLKPFLTMWQISSSRRVRSR